MSPARHQEVYRENIRITLEKSEDLGPMHLRKVYRENKFPVKFNLETPGEGEEILGKVFSDHVGS